MDRNSRTLSNKWRSLQESDGKRSYNPITPGSSAHQSPFAPSYSQQGYTSSTPTSSSHNVYVLKKLKTKE
eukprot:Pgem_evm1s13143